MKATDTDGTEWEIEFRKTNDKVIIDFKGSMANYYAETLLEDYPFTRSLCIHAGSNTVISADEINRILKTYLYMYGKCQHCRSAEWIVCPLCKENIIQCIKTDSLKTPNSESCESFNPI